nr:hypothetical protein [Leisingera aquaemixtae]
MRSAYRTKNELPGERAAISAIAKFGDPLNATAETASEAGYLEWEVADLRKEGVQNGAGNSFGNEFQSDPRTLPPNNVNFQRPNSLNCHRLKVSAIKLKALFHEFNTHATVANVQSYAPAAEAWKVQCARDFHA